MSFKSTLQWLSIKLWCEAHPGLTAAMMTPTGQFFVTFQRQASETTEPTDRQETNP